MPDEEIDVAEDTSSDVEEATNSNDNSEQEDTVDLAEEVERLRKANSQINARAKKAEEKLKALEATPPITNDPQLSDELKLIARGLSDEEIAKAKVIAKGNGTTLQEALKDDMFISYQAKLKDDQRKEKAKLGASKGSGETEPVITGLESGSSRDAHKEAFNKLVGNK